MSTRAQMSLNAVIGTICALIGTFGGGIAVVYSTGGTQARIDERLQQHERALSEIRDTMKADAVARTATVEQLARLKTLIEALPTKLNIVTAGFPAGQPK